MTNNSKYIEERVKLSREMAKKNQELNKKLFDAAFDTVIGGGELYIGGMVTSAVFDDYDELVKTPTGMLAAPICMLGGMALGTYGACKTIKGLGDMHAAIKAKKLLNKVETVTNLILDSTEAVDNAITEREQREKKKQEAETPSEEDHPSVVKAEETPAPEDEEISPYDKEAYDTLLRNIAAFQEVMNLKYPGIKITYKVYAIDKVRCQAVLSISHPYIWKSALYDSIDSILKKLPDHEELVFTRNLTQDGGVQVYLLNKWKYDDEDVYELGPHEEEDLENDQDPLFEARDQLKVILREKFPNLQIEEELTDTEDGEEEYHLIITPVDRETGEVYDHYEIYDSLAEFCSSVDVSGVAYEKGMDTKTFIVDVWLMKVKEDDEAGKDENPEDAPPEEVSDVEE